MESITAADFPTLAGLTDTQVQFFRENGFLVLRNLVGPDELQALTHDMSELIAKAVDGCKDEDYKYKPHEITGNVIPFRVEYVIAKSESCKLLLGHPVLLDAIRRLQGPEFIPTWDSLVFKRDGAGGGHEWHRDAVPYQSANVDAEVAAIDVGVYLDSSDITNCLWVIPESHRWSESQANDKADAYGSRFNSTANAIAVPVNAGDAILHNILTLHGSETTLGRGRRVIYYEFRQISAERALGPHTADYIPLKQRVLEECIRRRARASRVSSPCSFDNEPAVDPATGASPLSFRCAHQDYWRHPERFDP